MEIPAGAVLFTVVGVALVAIAAKAVGRSRGAPRAIGVAAAMPMLIVTIGALLAGCAPSPMPARLTNRPAPVPDALSIYYNGFYGAHTQNPGIHALRARDAAVRWQRPSALGTHTFTISDGVMYLASESLGTSPSTMLLALRASDGAQMWSRPIVNTSQPAGMATAVIGAPVIDGNTVLLNVDNGTVAYHTSLVIAMHKDDGRELWRRVIANSEGGTAAGGGLVYIGSLAPDSSMRAFRISDGSLAWQTAVDSHGTQPYYDNGVVYVYPVGYGQITALRASDGRVLWTHGDAARGIRAAVLEVSDGAVYVGGTDGTSPSTGIGFNMYVFALDAATGVLRWRFQVPSAGGQGRVDGVTAANGVVYVGATGGIFALDAATGAVRWRQSTGTFVVYQSPQLADGVIFTATEDVRAHIGGAGCLACEPDYFNALSARDGSFYWRTPLSWAGSPPPLVVA